jgi:predicted DNA binding CopG/RHH family protein
MKKKIPDFKSDAEAEAFVDSANLSEYDLSGFKPMRFEFQLKTERVNMRLPAELLQAVRRKAEAEGMPYQRFIRATLERAVAKQKTG